MPAVRIAAILAALNVTLALAPVSVVEPRANFGSQSRHYIKQMANMVERAIPARF